MGRYIRRIQEKNQKNRSSRAGMSLSLFIFDEMDEMPSGIMDVVKPFLDYNQPVEGTDYRRSVFLFLMKVMLHILLNKLLMYVY
ncbi:TOR1B-like protein [Mya arenaria]|uniref:TOR1B-like protein n=1 Tax=Mya arenaria TaxID=6604 RepID=A0ABY7DJS7_MYAAR|nr:TOR1B-like protein [Mya arenaria]